VAAFATEVKADIEKGFGTWKVKLKVNIQLFCVPPRESRECGNEGERVSRKSVDEGDSAQSTKTRENEVSRERRKGKVRRGCGRAGLTFVIVNGRWRAKAARAASRSLRGRVSTHVSISFSTGHMTSIYVYWATAVARVVLVLTAWQKINRSIFETACIMFATRRLTVINNIKRSLCSQTRLVGPFIRTLSG